MSAVFATKTGLNSPDSLQQIFVHTFPGHKQVVANLKLVALRALDEIYFMPISMLQMDIVWTLLSRSLVSRCESWSH